jgi:hypothetical protein
MSSPGRVADTAAIDTNAAMNTACIAPADVRSRSKEWRRQTQTRIYFMLYTKNFRELQAKATTPHSSPRTVTMQLRNGEHVLDAIPTTFDPHLDIATVVFSHVQCVKTRHSLSLVSKVWRDASKTAAAYPDRFDFNAFSDKSDWMWGTRCIRLLDNDEALSLPYERVVGLLGETAKDLCDDAALRGSVRLLRWARENNCVVWSTDTCSYAAQNGHLPALKYLHQNGCPWNWTTCFCAGIRERWDCLQYAVDNKAPEWEKYAEKHAEHLR